MVGQKLYILVLKTTIKKDLKHAIIMDHRVTKPKLKVFPPT